MNISDSRGEPVTATSAEALALYEKAVGEYQRYVGDPVATMDEALAIAPDFALGHELRASALLIPSERRFVAEAARSVAALEALAPRCNERERGHAVALRRFVDGDWRGAGLAFDRVLEDHPCDAIAVQTGHLIDFLTGDAVSLRDRIARVLPRWSAAQPGYSYLLGMHAFGLEECNQYDDAEQQARRALALQPKDGWAVHALGHVMEMQARFDEAIAFYRRTVPDWAPDNGFSFHNWWHLALYHVEREQWSTVLEIYDTEIWPDASADFSMQMLDASALLWRLHLYGVDVGDRWSTLADAWQRKAADENGYYAFNDVHALMAYLGAGHEQAAATLMDDLRRVASEGRNGNAVMMREVGLPVADGLLALARGRADDAVEHLLPARSIANRYGGSHAQRDLIAQTLLHAAIGAGRKGLALNLANERIEGKGGSPLAWAWMARTREACGDAAGSAQAAKQAGALRAA